MVKKAVKAQTRVQATMGEPVGPKTRVKPKGKPKASRPSVAETPEPSGLVLDRLWTVIQARRNADPNVSHSARLLSRGTPKVAQKFGEEAVECLIEAVSGNATALVNESADVLYHLLVLWAAGGIEPGMVWAELQRREGVSGIAEKAARSLRLPSGGRTRKIP